MRRLIQVIVLLVMLSGITVSIADAHHKDTHDKGGKKEKRTVEVTGSLGPDNPFLCCGAEVYTITNGGNPPNSPVYVSLASPGCCSGSKVFADDNGVATFAKETGAPGTYTAAFFRSTGNDIFTDPIYIIFEVIQPPE